MKMVFYKQIKLRKQVQSCIEHPRISSIALILAMVFFSTTLFGQLAPVNPPAGGFAIDGGLKANTPTSPSAAQPFLAPNQGDWYPGPGGTGGAVFNASGLPVNAATSGRAVPDPYNGNDNIFTTGSKFNDYIGDLHWFTNSAPDKNDINNALYHVSRDGGNNQWAFIAGDRLSTSGTSYIDFEFLQGTVTETATGFVGTPAAGKPGGGGRTQNDLVISMEYTNGGSKPNVYIYQWKLSGSTWSYQLASVPNLAANAFAETNRTGAETGLPYSAFGNTSYQQFAFVEAAVNVTYLINQTAGGDACSGLSIKTLWIKTKASASSTAALKDFVDPIPVNFQFGQAGITPAGPFCVDNTTPQTLEAMPAGGTFSGPGVSNGQFTPSVAGVGTHTISYAFSGCSATTTITVNPLPTISGTLSVCAGSTTQLTGSGTAATSNAWTSSNTSVATISATGLVTGITAGTSTITYTNSSGCQKTAIVTVNPLPSITGTLSVCVGSTTLLSGSATAAASNAWSSSNIGVATISATGLVTGVSAGTSTITYTNTNGCQQTAVVTVNPLPTISGTLAVCVGSTTQLSGSATAAASNAWSSSNTAVATISTTGLVTGVTAGTSTITYTNSNGCQQTAIVTVNALPTITGTLAVCAGSTTQLTGSATAAASNGWSSSNPLIATISATGLVTGVSAGTSTITYTNSNGCQQTAIITVNPLPTISGTLAVCAGSTTQLTGSATAAASNAWSSSNTAVATISATGLVTGVTAGTSTITYTNSNGCQQTAIVTVNALPTISGTLSVCAGSTTQLTGSATAAASNAWSSSNTAVATISATGLVTGVTAGTSTITYTNSNGCQQTAIVTVNPLPTISGTLAVCAGSTTQLTGSATAAASNAWSSSNPLIATISATGLVTGVSAGTSTITYTNSNGCQQTAIVTVNALPTITGTLDVCAGSTTQLTGSATAAASNAWSSSNTAVATISATGLVTGISAGTSTITYTNSNGCQQTALVTVNALPLAPQLNVVQPTCGNSNGTVSVISPVGTDFVYSNNNGTFQASASFTVASNAAYSIKVKRVSTGCISAATPGTMGSAQGTPAADVVIQSNPSCSSLTGTLKVVQAGGADFDNTIYEFSNDGTNFGSNPVFTFTAGQGYNITVRRISDHTCTATTACTGQAAAKTASTLSNQATSLVTNPTVTYIAPEQVRVTAYPNPFSNMVRFAIESPIAGKATLDVYNTTGQKLQTIYQGYLFAGKQQLINYRPSTTNGTLIYTLKVGNQQVNGKLIQLKP